jgi:hypothetical protein
MICYGSIEFKKIRQENWEKVDKLLSVENLAPGKLRYHEVYNGDFVFCMIDLDPEHVDAIEQALAKNEDISDYTLEIAPVEDNKFL